MNAGVQVVDKSGILSVLSIFCHYHCATIVKRNCFSHNNDVKFVIPTYLMRREIVFRHVTGTRPSMNHISGESLVALIVFVVGIEYVQLRQTNGMQEH